MFCPECGNDAEDAKFCPECGADLRGLASDPTCDACGSDVPEGARFCPECGEATGARSGEGAGAADVPQAAPAAGAAGAAAGGGGRRTGTRGRGSGASRQQRRQQPPQRKSRQQPTGAKAAAGSPKRISPAMIWGGFGIAAIIIILLVVLVTNRSGDATDTPVAGGTQSVQPVSADTSGSYGALVERANGLYDQGAEAFDAKQYDQGAAYFEAAAKVYAAAWKRQSTDPGVGTDYATSLFYSGEVDRAVSQVEKVLAQSPEFQTAWFNKGNYLAEKARQADQDGEAKPAKAAFADARDAYQKAVSLDASSASGQQAQQRLDELPQ